MKEETEAQESPANTTRGTFYVEGTELRHELDAPIKPAVAEQPKPTPKATPEPKPTPAKAAAIQETN